MPKTENFRPVLRFAAMSDVHFKDYHSVERERFRTALANSYAFAAQDAEHPTLDALCVIGDFTDRGTETQLQAFHEALTKQLRPETHLILSIASHEFGDAGTAVAEERLARIFGKKPDEHAVVQGFHFISMSPSKKFSPKNGYCEQKRAWMLDQLDMAAADNPKKPIFAFQHPHIPNTVYGSIGWSCDDITGIYDDYPQVINFSGHSHAPINDPRSIHQNNFTSLNMGSLSYFELDEFDKIYGTVPPDRAQCAQFYIVEADAENRVRILLYDILTESFFPEVWHIDEPSNRDSFLYTDEKRKKDNLPYFKPQAVLSVEVKDGGACVLRIPQADIAEEYVNDYDIAFRDAKTGEALRRFAVWSKYYLRHMPDEIVQEVDGLIPGKAYVVEVWPRNFYGRRGKTKLTAEFVAK
jgi:hypothetical protein